jgi:single-strand DNA-binding protein
MKDVNKVILVGRLGADPVLRETKSGATVVNFSVATSRWVKPTEPHAATASESRPEGDAWKEETQWHHVVAWGRMGEVCATYLKKGHPIYVEGSFSSRKYEAKDGTERVSYEVIADDVSFLGGRPRSDSPAEGVELRIATN